MKPNIVFLDEYSICGRDMTSVKELGNYTAYDNTLPEQVVERCTDADIVISNKVVLDAEKLKQLPRLRLICVAATGMNNVDLEAAASLGIEVRNAVGYSTYSVAETTICSALSLLREVVYYDRYFKSGEYSASGRMFCFDRPTAQIRGKNWGIIGLGNIGREVARLATAFGCDVRYFSTSGTTRKEDYPAVGLDELLGWADILSIHCPLNGRTRNLIGRNELDKMKRSAIIINVARGGIIDEQALAEALDADKIRGAALDVFTSEPTNPDSPLLKIVDPCKLLASPHNAWSTVEAIDRLIGCVANNIREYLNNL
ncbi:MAG TPA: hydroxyacid dehydrogenase [Candidatus Alistipes excrementipullorum]|nr:hydroxyacid dehydrogenase [Candidatus Alistipes excrementipullorum]